MGEGPPGRSPGGCRAGPHTSMWHQSLRSTASLDPDDDGDLTTSPACSCLMLPSGALQTQTASSLSDEGQISLLGFPAWFPGVQAAI